MSDAGEMGRRRTDMDRILVLERALEGSRRDLERSQETLRDQYVMAALASYQRPSGRQLAPVEAADFAEEVADILLKRREGRD